MPYKDKAKQAEYMRKRRAAQRVNVNPLTQNVNPERKPVNLVRQESKPNYNEKKISHITGSYEDGYWTGICPVCNRHNKMDPKRSFRPVDKCSHFQQLESPGKPSTLLFKRGLTSRKVNDPNPDKIVNPLTHPVNPVNPNTATYLLSYSRKKYQFVLYRLDSEGERSLVRSYAKGEKVTFGSVEIELTWGPEEAVKEVQ